MAINIFNLQPNKVSKDLSGYITYIYGAPKTGKTTLAVQMPKTLLLAFEPGYKALPGVIAQDITTWGEMKQVLNQLKRPEGKEMFNAVVIDTVDVASEVCQKYICQQLNIDNMGDGGWGTNSWAKFKIEFNDTFRKLAQLGYAVFFIGHEKEVQNGDKMIIRPALSPTSICLAVEGMADIFGYAHQTASREMSVLTLRYPDDTVHCGGRFKYIANEIDLSYDNLVKAVHDAIDKEAKEHDNKFVTSERAVMNEAPTYDYDALMAEFKQLSEALMTKDQSYVSKIVKTIETYLGKGKKISDTNPDQAELVFLINQDLKAL